MEHKPALTIGQYSAAGRKDSNDDCFGVMMPQPPLLATKGMAMAVADGVSACAAAKAASESCVKSFLDDYYSTPESWTVRTSVSRILSALNRWLYGQGQAHSGPASRGGMISTFSGLILKSATAHIFHVGDSRIYHLRGGVLEQLTTDHRLLAARDKDYLSRALGAGLHAEIDCRSLAVAAGDIFLFTTDGVHDYLRDDQMLELIAAHGDDLDATARDIAGAAFANDSPDNLTCQIVRVDEPGREDAESHYRKLQELPFPPDMEPGNVMDGYRILRELHASSRSQLYLALDEESGEQVVVKTPSINYVDDPGYLEAFGREEWVGRRLDSPHVLKLREATRRRRFLYYVTEYVEGVTLRQWMHDNPRPTLAQVRPLAEQVAAGLRVFHRKEMIHQDLKPENILIDPHGTVKIIDFGSTKIAGLEEIASPSRATHPMGTVGYSAPEYVLEHPVSNRSDIFSLGVIVYEMLTGKLPYGEGFASRRDTHRLTYIPATRHNQDIPPWVDAALARAVHRDSEKRYPALSEFLGDLSAPNPAFVVDPGAPLIERDPTAFWRVATALLLLANLILLTRLF